MWSSAIFFKEPAGGFGLAAGSVAQVLMQVPSKYVGKNLKVSCK